MPGLMHRARSHAIMLGLMAALFLMALIGVGGMVSSVIVAEQVQGSGSAINVAGSLRRLSHRIGSIVLSDAENRVEDRSALRIALLVFEQNLRHKALLAVLKRQPDRPFAVTYAQVRQDWEQRLLPSLQEELNHPGDPTAVGRHNLLLLQIDEFVDRINVLVTELEVDTEERLRRLRNILWAALFVFVLLFGIAIYGIHRGILAPLSGLLDNASRIARGDFDARSERTGPDELGRLGQAFNGMAEELSRQYRNLEQKVAEKTTELTRSNRSLALLYDTISRLHHGPATPETYEEVLAQLNASLGLRGSLACQLSRTGAEGLIMASTLVSCHDGQKGDCGTCLAQMQAGCAWECRSDAGEHEQLLSLPLGDQNGTYGVLRLSLPEAGLEPWQLQLVNALAGHLGVAMGVARKSEQQRLLALQEERSIIARELHDSIAQALSYLKIQASLLQPLLSDPARSAEAAQVLTDMRNGIAAAYRQLRELLATFRLKMEGDFIALLDATVNEYAQRGGIPVVLNERLENAHLTPNQEIHVLQIVREALANVLRHAEASTAWVEVCQQPSGELQVSVADDGRGFDAGMPPEGLHYGLSIMQERAHGLSGQLKIGPRPGGGTLVSLSFDPDTESLQ